MRTFTSACPRPCVDARPYTSNSSPSIPANPLLYPLNPSRRRAPQLQPVPRYILRAAALDPDSFFTTSSLLSACCPSPKAKTARHNPRSSAGPRNKGRSPPKIAGVRGVRLRLFRPKKRSTSRPHIARNCNLAQRRGSKSTSAAKVLKQYACSATERCRLSKASNNDEWHVD